MTNERIEQVRLALVNKVVPLSKKAEYVRIFECGVAWADEHPVNPWISVNDRLPEDNKKGYNKYWVLVRRDEENVFRAYYHARTKAWYTDGYCGEIEIEQPEYWMPIPSLKRDEEDIDDPRLTEKQKKELGYK